MLHYELATFNIKIKIIEPGLIKADFYGRIRVEVTPEEDEEYQKYEDIADESGSRKKIKNHKKWPKSFIRPPIYGIR